MSANSSTSSSEATTAGAGYLRLVAILVFGPLIGLAAFTWTVDPYGVLDAPLRPGINTVKHGFTNHLRLAKAHAVAKIRPRTVILGSSRAETAIDPAHPGFSALPAYNLAMSGAGTYEVLRYLQHAEGVRRLDLAVIGLDLFMFNAAWPIQPGFDEARLSLAIDGTPQRHWGGDLLAALLSREAIADSWWSLHHQGDAIAAYGPDGARDERYDIPAILAGGGHRQAFRQSQEYFVRYGYFPATPPPPFRFADRRKGVDTLDLLRRTLAAARTHATRVILFISPVHAEQLELMRRLGLWPQFEQWKRDLVQIVDADAARHPGEAPIDLWDFSGYNAITTETVPAAGDHETAMHWYRESSHFTRAAGDLVLDRVLGYRSTARPMPDGFGVRLAVDNIEAALAGIRAGQAQWLREHASESAEIAAIAAHRPAAVPK